MHSVMNRNTNNVISQYLNFAADVNNNIAASIQLLNHLRLSVTDVVNHHTALASLNPPPIRRPLSLGGLGLGNSLSERSFGVNRRHRADSSTRRSTRSSQTNRRASTLYRRTFSGVRPPTNAAIINATSVCRYVDLSTNYVMCPIRQTLFDASDSVMKIDHCGHIFLESALREWFRTSSECPVCRHNMNTNSSRTAERRTESADPVALRNTLQRLFDFRDSSNNSIVDSSGQTFNMDASSNSLLYLEYTFPLSMT